MILLSAAPSPAIFSRFTRAVSPDAKLMPLGATPSARASNFTTAALAAPSLAAARTRTFSTLRPSDSWATPSIESRPPFGVTRTDMAMPSGTGEQKLAADAVTGSSSD